MCAQLGSLKSTKRTHGWRHMRRTALMRRISMKAMTQHSGEVSISFNLYDEESDERKLFPDKELRSLGAV